MKISFKAILALGLTAFASSAAAQDSHYWSNQFGPRSSLLGGAVVGSVRDTSAGYYNPGALGFVENESLQVSANALKYESVSLDNGAGTGDDLDSEEVQAIPLLVSGILKSEDLPGHTFGYTLLTRNSSNLSFSERRDAITEVLGSAPGEENYIGQFSFDQEINEYWAGLSWAHKPCDNISVGLTNFVAYRSERFQNNTFARAVNVANPANAVITDASRLVDYTSINLLWKGGVAAEFEGFKLGLTVTSPSVNIYGDGITAADVTISGDIDGDGFTDNVVGDDRQDSIDAEYRTPFSLAVGAEVDLAESTKLHATGEWFGAQGRYNSIVPENNDFIRPTGTGILNSRDVLLVSSSNEAVVNWGLGLEQVLTDKMTGFFSIRSDYDSLAEYDGPGTTLGISSWDIYHATVGATYKRENSELGVGLTYSFGDTNNAAQPVNFSNPSTDNALLGVPENTSVDYEAVTLMLGYTYYIR